MFHRLLLPAPLLYAATVKRLKLQQPQPSLHYPPSTPLSRPSLSKSSTMTLTPSSFPPLMAFQRQHTIHLPPMSPASSNSDKWNFQRPLLNQCP
uniref:Uncharacterized protein n=1 Tax=Arundo donax TaxID=35708 RepID=A0A0A9F1K1_ARUDO